MSLVKFLRMKGDHTSYCAAAEIERLTAERDALMADAMRYRWLRSSPTWLGWDHDFREDEVEREIDNAMKEWK
jgi:hypothetical protein